MCSRVGTYLDFVVLSEEEKMKLSNGDLVEVSSDEEGPGSVHDL